MFINSYSFASDCKAVKWPFSKNIKDIQPLSYQALPRDHLYKYLYYELSSDPKVRVKELAARLFYYLKNSEQNEDKYQMIMALEWVADLKTQNPRIIPIEEICSMEDKIERGPSSTKKSKSIKKSKK